MRSCNSNSAGFTLTEIIVAAGIFAFVIAGGISGVRMGFQVVENSRHHTRVSQILQSEIESLRSLSWSELNQLPSSHELDITPEFATSAYEMYTVRRTISSESSSLKRIEVLVSYEKRSGKTVELKYLTFFTEGGVNDYYYRTI